MKKGEGLVLAFDFGKASVLSGIDMNKGFPWETRLKADLWYMDYLDKPQTFVSVIKKFELKEGEHPTDYAQPGINPFTEAGLEPCPSRMVRAPGVAGCLARAECRLVEEICRKEYTLVIGRVVHLEADDNYFNEAGEMDYDRAGPLSVMLGDKGMWFTRPVFAGRYAKYSEMSAIKRDSLVNKSLMCLRAILPGNCP